MFNFGSIPDITGFRSNGIRSHGTLPRPIYFKVIMNGRLAIFSEHWTAWYD